MPAWFIELSAFAIEIELIVKRLQTNSQQLSSARFVVFSFLERAHDHLPLNFLDRRTDRKGDCIFVSQTLALVDWIWSKVMTLDLLTRANNYRALDYVS